MLSNTSLKQFKHKISFAIALIFIGIVFSATSFSQTTQCSIGTPTNLVSSPPQTAFLSDNNTDTYIDIPLIANPNIYKRSGNNIIVNMQWGWSNGFPVAVSGASTLEIVVNNVVYARIVTTNDGGTTGTFTAQNSALINTANSSAPTWGTSTTITGVAPFAGIPLFNGSVQLPSTVTQINKVQVHFIAPNNGSADDIQYSVNNVSACTVPNLSVVKTSNGPWIIGQAGSQYTLTATNSGSASTSSTTTVRDILPTGITPNWVGTRTVTSNGITWACTFSGQNVTCTTSNNISNTGTNTSQITLPVNVTNSATVGTNTNYASIGGGGDPNNSGTAPTPGASCSDATHCASNQSTVSALPPNVSLLKSCPTPTNCTTAPQSPGTDLTYKIAYTNSGGQGALNMIIVDAIPAATDYKLGSAAANLGTTGLTLVIEYSSDYDPLNPTVATWNYTPVSGGGGASAGYDRRVKAVRWKVTAGALSNVSPNYTGDVSFITKIR